ncbi:kinase-like protein [Trametopsis cervina]|nr:kinase-like protein [Trametopsis cervina]
MQDTSSPKLTPALTASSHATPTAIVDDPFLPTPTGAENISLTSFLFPSRSFEIEQYTNLKDVVPEWEDDEVDELVVLSPKSKIPKSLSVIEETQEAPASPSISLFQNIKVISIPQTSPRVCVVKYAESGELYALKTYSKATISYDTPTLEYAVREQMILRLLTQMDAPFILKLRWSFQDREAMHIVTDYSPQGDMRAYIERSGPMAPANARICAAELVDALWALHRNGITHHAIRPEHILFDASGHILLTGFSRASVSAPNGPQISYSPQPANEQPRHRRELRDIDEWSAPEAVLGWPQDSAVDCWAFGLLLWYMITGKHAFIAQYERNSISALHLDVLSSLILHSFPELQAEDEQKDVRELVYWCLQRNARLRSTAQGIKGHSYFSAMCVFVSSATHDYLPGYSDWAQLRMKKYPGASGTLYLCYFLISSAQWS